MTFNENDILVVNDVLKILKVSRVHLYRMIKSNKIPFFRIDKIYYFSRTELSNWFNSKSNFIINEIEAPQKESIEDELINIEDNKPIFNHKVSIRLANRLKPYCDHNKIEYHKTSFYDNGFLFVDFKDVLKIDLSKIKKYRNFGPICEKELIELQKLANNLI